MFGLVLGLAGLVTLIVVGRTRTGADKARSKQNAGAWRGAGTPQATGKNAGAWRGAVAGERGPHSRKLPAQTLAVLKSIKAGEVPTPAKVELAARWADRGGRPDVAARLRAFNEPPPSVKQAVADLGAESATYEQLTEAAEEAEDAGFRAMAVLLRAASAGKAPATVTVSTEPSEGAEAGAEGAAVAAAPPPPSPARVWQNAPPDGVASWPDGPGSGLSDPGRPTGEDTDDVAEGGDGGDYDSGESEG